MPTDLSKNNNSTNPPKETSAGNKPGKNKYDYTVCLVIPFSFDCSVGQLSKAEQFIESKKVLDPTNHSHEYFWKRRTFQRNDLYPYVEELFDRANEHHVGAIYYATGKHFNYLLGGGKYTIKKIQSDSNYFLGCTYSFINLTLGVFETGRGFLCMEIAIDYSSDGDISISKLRQVVDGLRRVTSPDYEHFRCSENKEKVSLRKMIRIALASDKEMTRMTLAPDDKQKNVKYNKFTFQNGLEIDTPNKDERVFAQIYINTENNNTIQAYSDESIITTFLRNANQCNSQNTAYQPLLQSSEHLFNPYQGMAIGLSNGTTSVLRTKDNAVSSNIVLVSLRNTLLPLTMLALHQKYALLQFLSDMNSNPKNKRETCEQIELFNQKFAFTLVSDKVYYQEFFEQMMELNMVNKLIRETQPKNENLLNFAKETRRNMLDKITGIFSILFALMSITSILNDGMQIVDRLVDPQYTPYFKYGLLGLSVIMLLVGLGSLISLNRSSK